MIANQATNFSVGANLMLLLISAQESEWDDIHMLVRQFQRANMAIKYAPRPVVSAPQGMALGGGCEINLHAARIHAAAELYMGLVETGVGLIPGGGGTKEMLIRANEHAAGCRGSRSVSRDEADFRKRGDGERSRPAPKMRARWDICGRRISISMNRDRLVADAKQTALAMVRAGYHRSGAGGNSRAGRGVSGGGEACHSSAGSGRIRVRV